MFKLNPEKYRKDFPLVKKYSYFDNACVTLKPSQVINKINEYYKEYPGCAGRSNHSIARRVTQEINSSREVIQKQFKNKVVFTRNTTEAINLIAKSYPFKKTDVILLSDKEHNSNLVPWQELGLKLLFFEHSNIEDFKEKLAKADFVATNHISNLDGKKQDIELMAKLAKKQGIKILIDGAQGLPHTEVNTSKFDFYVASGHKMLGPSGTGLLFLNEKNLYLLKSYNVGGDTVRDTYYDKSIFETGTKRFEAGLQNYAGMLGLKEAVSYLKKVGINKIAKHELKLKNLAQELLQEEIDVLEGDSGILSFNIKGLDPHDVALQLDSKNILVRSGYHCCHSWFNANKIKGSVRASFYLYNTQEEVEKFAKALKEVKQILK